MISHCHVRCAYFCVRCSCRVRYDENHPCCCSLSVLQIARARCLPASQAKFRSSVLTNHFDFVSCPGTTTCRTATPSASPFWLLRCEPRCGPARKRSSHATLQLPHCRRHSRGSTTGSDEGAPRRRAAPARRATRGAGTDPHHHWARPHKSACVDGDTGDNLLPHPGVGQHQSQGSFPLRRGQHAILCQALPTPSAQATIQCS